MQIQGGLLRFLHAFGNPTWLLVCCGCVYVPSNEQVAQSTAPVVYGTDDRVELGESAHPAARLFEGALVALIPKSRLYELASGEKEVRAPTLGVARGLCPGERFAEEPSAAECSGTLASNGLVLTARHCVTSLEHCHSLSWVFGYAYGQNRELAPFAEEDTYDCQRLVASAYDREHGIDYAWIELDRPVVGRHPMEIPTFAAPLASNAPLLAAGFGQGLPAKLDPDVRFLASQGNYFTAAFDSFNGSSGMPLLTPDGTWVGFALRGEEDYESIGGCRRAKILGANCEGCVFGGEQVAYLSPALDGLRAAQPTDAKNTYGQREAEASLESAAGIAHTPDAGLAAAPEPVQDAGPSDAVESMSEPLSTPLDASNEREAEATSHSSEGTASCAVVGARYSDWSVLRAWPWALAIAVALRLRRL